MFQKHLRHGLLILLGIVIGIIVAGMFLGKPSRNVDPHAGHIMPGADQEKKNQALDMFHASSNQAFDARSVPHMWNGFDSRVC